VSVEQGDSMAKAQVVLDAAIPAGCVRIPSAVAGSETLGVQIGPVSVHKV